MAKVSQSLFGVDFIPERVIGETLERATPEIDPAETSLQNTTYHGQMELDHETFPCYLVEVEERIEASHIQQSEETVMTAERKPPPVLTKFRPRRAAFSFTAKLREPLWVLAHDLPAICSRVLERLAPFAVGLNDLRVDNADGRLGESSLGFWTLDFQARCEIRLTGVDVQCHELHQIDIRQLDRLIQAVLGTVLESQEDAAFINYEVTVRMHGAPQGSDPEIFLGRFTGPGLEGLGPITGSGVSFYFGPCSRRISCAVLADISTSFADSIYVQTRALFDGEQLPIEEIEVETGKYLKASLAALGLTLPETGESK